MQRGAGAKLKCSMDWSKPKRVEPNKALEHWEMMGGWEGFSFTHLSVFPKMHLRIRFQNPNPPDRPGFVMAVGYCQVMLERPKGPSETKRDRRDRVGCWTFSVFHVRGIVRFEGAGVTDRFSGSPKNRRGT